MSHKLWIPSAVAGAALCLLGCGADDADPDGGATSARPDTARNGDEPEEPEVSETPELSSDPAIAAIQKFIRDQDLQVQTEGNWRTRLPMPPQVSFDESKKYYWNLKTSQGDVEIELMPDVAPMHVSSTIYLTELGFYDDLKFHRVIQGFMAQGGCPLGTGTGGPGYSYGSEIDPDVKHDRPGLLSMANTGRPNSDGSQFFLTFNETPWLDGKHTVFGMVTEGMSTLKKLEARGSQGGQTTEELKLIDASIAVR